MTLNFDEEKSKIETPASNVHWVEGGPCQSGWQVGEHLLCIVLMLLFIISVVDV